MNTVDIISMILTLGLLALLYGFRNKLAVTGLILDIRYWFFRRKVWAKRHTDTDQFDRVRAHDPWLKAKWEKEQARRKMTEV